MFHLSPHSRSFAKLNEKLDRLAMQAQLATLARVCDRALALLVLRDTDDLAFVDDPARVQQLLDMYNGNRVMLELVTAVPAPELVPGPDTQALLRHIHSAFYLLKQCMTRVQRHK